VEELSGNRSLVQYQATSEKVEIRGKRELSPKVILQAMKRMKEKK